MNTQIYIKGELALICVLVVSTHELLDKLNSKTKWIERSY